MPTGHRPELPEELEAVLREAADQLKRGYEAASAAASRRFLENGLKHLARHSGVRVGRLPLYSMVDELHAVGCLSDAIATLSHQLRDITNAGAHQAKISHERAYKALRLSEQFAEWLAQQLPQKQMPPREEDQPRRGVEDVAQHSIGTDQLIADLKRQLAKDYLVEPRRYEGGLPELDVTQGGLEGTGEPAHHRPQEQATKTTDVVYGGPSPQAQRAGILVLFGMLGIAGGAIAFGALGAGGSASQPAAPTPTTSIATSSTSAVSSPPVEAQATADVSPACVSSQGATMISFVATSLWSTKAPTHPGFPWCFKNPTEIAVQCRPDDGDDEFGWGACNGTSKYFRVRATMQERIETGVWWLDNNGNEANFYAQPIASQTATAQTQAPAALGAPQLFLALADQADRESHAAAKAGQTEDAKTWADWSLLYRRLAASPAMQNKSAIQLTDEDERGTTSLAAITRDPRTAALAQASADMWRSLHEQLASGSPLVIVFPKREMLTPVPGLDGTPWQSEAAASRATYTTSNSAYPDRGPGVIPNNPPVARAPREVPTNPYAGRAYAALWPGVGYAYLGYGRRHDSGEITCAWQYVGAHSAPASQQARCPLGAP